MVLIEGLFLDRWRGPREDELTAAIVCCVIIRSLGYQLESYARTPAINFHKRLLEFLAAAVPPITQPIVLSTSESSCTTDRTNRSGCASVAHSPARSFPIPARRGRRCQFETESSALHSAAAAHPTKLDRPDSSAPECVTSAVHPDPAESVDCGSSKRSEAPKLNRVHALRQIELDNFAYYRELLVINSKRRICGDA